MHEKLKPSWVPPPAPTRYPDLVVVHWLRQTGGEWHMDFARDSAEGMFFASDADRCPAIEWPWVEGHSPTTSDWRVAGFRVLEVPADSETIRKAAQTLIAAFMRGNQPLH